MNLDDYQTPKAIRDALQGQRIAIVGLSSNELRASHFVGFYLQRHGYEIVPVNPRETEVLGCRAYPSLTDVPGHIDTVDVFRDPSALPEITRDAIAAGASTLWLQYGVIHEPSIQQADAAGMRVIADRCIKVEHARYRGRMHWLGFNTEQISARRSVR